MCRSLFFIKLQALACSFVKNRLQYKCFPMNFAKRLRTLWHKCFPGNFAKLFRTPSLPNTSRQMLLKNQYRVTGVSFSIHHHQCIFVNLVDTMLSRTPFQICLSEHICSRISRFRRKFSLSSMLVFGLPVDFRAGSAYMASVFLAGVFSGSRNRRPNYDKRLFRMVMLHVFVLVLLYSLSFVIFLAQFTLTTFRRSVFAEMCQFCFQDFL